MLLIVATLSVRKMSAMKHTALWSVQFVQMQIWPGHAQIVSAFCVKTGISIRMNWQLNFPHSLKIYQSAFHV